MSTPSEIIYARVPVALRIGERLRKLREDTYDYRPIGKIVAELLDKALPPIAEPAKRAAAKGKVRK